MNTDLIFYLLSVFDPCASVAEDLIVAFQIHVAPVGNKHVTRFVRDEKRWLDFHGNGLGSDAAGPEDRHFARFDRNRVAEIRVHDVVDADRSRIPRM